MNEKLGNFHNSCEPFCNRCTVGGFFVNFLLTPFKLLGLGLEEPTGNLVIVVLLYLITICFHGKSVERIDCESDGLPLPKMAHQNQAPNNASLKGFIKRVIRTMRFVFSHA